MYLEYFLPLWALLTVTLAEQGHGLCEATYLGSSYQIRQNRAIV